MQLPPDPLVDPVPLTDAAAVATLLADTLAPAAGPLRLRLRYLEHDIGASLLVWYRAETSEGGADVVLSRHRRSWPETPPGWEAASAAAGTDALRASGVERPAADVAGTTVAWYPFDPGLPALARDPAGLVPADAGPRASRRRPDSPWRRLAWVPQQRAVLATDDLVVKIEADPERLRAGVRNLELLRPIVRTPAVLAVDEPSGVYVQELLAGRPLGPPDAAAWAGTAGELVARMVAATATATAAATRASGPGDDPWPVPPVGPPDLLAVTEPVQRLVAHAAPDLAPRIARVAEALAVSAPRLDGPSDLHLAHGDFNAGQLLALPRGGLGLVDTDTLCLAPAGLDLASYAVNLLAGRPDDLIAADATLVSLLQGYGEPPQPLPWLTAVAALRRLDRPIRRYKANWRQRVERHLADVETLVGRV